MREVVGAEGDEDPVRNEQQGANDLLTYVVEQVSAHDEARGGCDGNHEAEGWQEASCAPPPEISEVDASLGIVLAHEQCSDEKA